MNDYAMIIDGRSVLGRQRFAVRNPATGEVFAYAPDCTREDLDTAMAAAARAFPAWRADEAARRVALNSIAEAIQKIGDDIAPVLTAEQGKPLAAAASEVARAGSWFHYFANLKIHEEIIQDDSAAQISVVRRPLGVVAAITPWNVPILLAAWKLAPALAAGNTVVLKPSPYTPLSTLILGRLLAKHLPPGVINIVSGGDDLGKWMTSHEVPRKISFTGSVTTGKAVAVAAAVDLKRVTLELGGNDPAIVVRDVKVSDIAEKLFWAAFANCGQVCAAVKRVYVHEDIHDDLVEAVAAVAAAVRVGDGAVEGTQLGPINNSLQRDRVRDLVGDAVAHGARAVCGGSELVRPGYFFQPTILSGISDGVRIVDEEQFGPALPFIAYREVDDAVVRANASHYGLSASVWATDTDYACKVAAKLDCGTTWVNNHMALGPNQPFGGTKWSGIGVENGSWGLNAFTELQVRSVARK